MHIGFVGLGAMGAGIVPRLMAAGHAVTGWNRSKAKAEPLIARGMRLAETPRAVAAGSDVVFSSPRTRSIAAWEDNHDIHRRTDWRRLGESHEANGSEDE